MSPTEETRQQEFIQLTDINRFKYFKCPDSLTIKGNVVRIPDCIKFQRPHFLFDAEGELIDATWVTPTLAHIILASQTEDYSLVEKRLQDAIDNIDSEISKFIKKDLLTDRGGLGLMAMVQANENIPADCIAITRRTYDALLSRNKNWSNVKSVEVIRYPNLGPSTTKKMRLLVLSEERLEESTGMINVQEGSLAERMDLTSLRKLIESVKDTDETVNFNILDAIYMNPEPLKEDLKGDGDGDLIFVKKLSGGKPIFRKIDLTRNPSEVFPDIDILIKKSDRVQEIPIEEWLPTYIDSIPIGEATYAIRFATYDLASDLYNTEDPNFHAMYEAWKKLNYWAIELTEFFMDFRKGDFTQEQMLSKLKEVETLINKIKEAQKNNIWFTKIVTTPEVQDIENLVKEFSTLQQLLNKITCQHFTPVLKKKTVTQELKKKSNKKSKKDTSRMDWEL